MSDTPPLVMRLLRALIATAVEAGLPLMQALRTVRRQATGKAQPAILDALIEKVEAGQPLHEAMRAYGPPFDDMTIGMARAADASGRMPEVLHQLADLLDRAGRITETLTCPVHDLSLSGAGLVIDRGLQEGAAVEITIRDEDGRVVER